MMRWLRTGMRWLRRKPPAVPVDQSAMIDPLPDLKPEDALPLPELEAALQGLVKSTIQMIEVGETEDSNVTTIFTDRGLFQIVSLKTEHVGLCVRLAPPGHVCEWVRRNGDGRVVECTS